MDIHTETHLEQSGTHSHFKGQVQEPQFQELCRPEVKVIQPRVGRVPSEEFQVNQADIIASWAQTKGTAETSGTKIFKIHNITSRTTE